MPEDHGSLVRLRTSMEREAYTRFEALAIAVGLPVERVIGLAAVQALPEFERRINAVLGLGQPPAGGGDAAGTANAVDAGDAAGRVLNEDRPQYSSVPRGGQGGGKRKRNR